MTDNKNIYVDYAAATPLDPDVLKSMQPYWSDVFGNANAIHKHGQQAHEAIEASRSVIASYIGAKPHELIFTGSGTESNNIAVIGLIDNMLEKAPDRPLHVITSAIEHPSVLDAFRKLERRGVRVSYIGVTIEGFFDMDAFLRELSEETALVSVMFANNEIGTLEPIGEIGRTIRGHRKKAKKKTPYFHTDASQAPLYFSLDVNKLGVDLLTVDAQKLHGPKGVGALFIRSGVVVNPVCYGGSQERGIRPGTVNTPGVVGFAKAYELAEERRAEDSIRVKTLSERLLNRLEQELPEIYLNGSREKRLPNNINISFPGIEGEYLVALLDEQGISASTKSACLSGGGEGSYVVAALDRSRAKSSVRITIGRQTTDKDVDKIARTIVELVSKLKRA